MEELPQGEARGFGDLPADSFTHGSFFYGTLTITTGQQVSLHILPDLDPEEEGEVGFQGPVSVTEEGELVAFQGPVSVIAAAYGFQGPGQRQQQQGKRGRVSEAAILRLLREVKATSTPTDCCAICLEDFAAAAAPLTLRAMPGCSHAFHQHCIVKWLCRNVVCPLCRHKLEEEEEEEEEQRRPRTRRRSSYDDWLSFRGSRSGRVLD